jgi:hypothetical protein
MPGRPRIADEFYQNCLEQMLARNMARIKEQMLALLAREHVVWSFNHMNEQVRGDRSTKLLCWQELKRDGAIEPCKIGWCEPGRARYINEVIVTRKIRKNGYGDSVRKQFFGDHQPRLMSIREARKAWQEAEEAQKKATAMVDKLAAAAKPLLENL